MIFWFIVFLKKFFGFHVRPKFKTGDFVVPNSRYAMMVLRLSYKKEIAYKFNLSTIFLVIDHDFAHDFKFDEILITISIDGVTTQINQDLFDLWK